MDTTDRTFLVECYLPGVTEASVAEAGDRARASAADLVAEGTPVTYLGATLIAADEVVFHAFRASELADVEAISRAAGLAFERIVESVAVGSDAITAIRSST
jgi:hypothetical protein